MNMFEIEGFYFAYNVQDRHKSFKNLRIEVFVVQELLQDAHLIYFVYYYFFV